MVVVYADFGGSPRVETSVFLGGSLVLRRRIAKTAVRLQPPVCPRPARGLACFDYACSRLIAIIGRNYCPFWKKHWPHVVNPASSPSNRL